MTKLVSSVPCDALLKYGWQIDPYLWAQVPEDLRGGSWRFVDFAEIEADAIPQGQSGIYVFCACPVGYRLVLTGRSDDLFSNLLTPIYVGRTNNLRRRFLEHCRYPSTQVEAARACFGSSITFWFHRVSVDRIRFYESVLIGCFGPAANRRDETITATLGPSRPIGIR